MAWEFPEVVWAVNDVFWSLTQHLDEIEQFTEVTIRGLQALKEKGSAEVLAEGAALLDGDKIEASATSDDALSLTTLRQAFVALAHRAREDREFVKAQEKAGFIPVYAQGCISAWGFLESHVDDMLVALLSNDRQLLANEDVQKIRMSIGLYEATTPSERYEFLVDTIQKEMNSKFRRGIAQFESVFEKLGFSGFLHEQLPRTFVEFAAVRNTLVHRRGRADRRFIDAVPWLGLSVGAPIVVTENMWRHYMTSARLYAAQLAHRVFEHYVPADSADPPDPRGIEIFTRLVAMTTKGFEREVKQRGWMHWRCDHLS